MGTAFKMSIVLFASGVEKTRSNNGLHVHTVLRNVKDRCGAKVGGLSIIVRGK